MEADGRARGISAGGSDLGFRQIMPFAVSPRARVSEARDQCWSQSLPTGVREQCRIKAGTCDLDRRHCIVSACVRARSRSQLPTLIRRSLSSRACASCYFRVDVAALSATKSLVLLPF
jgi:hypothetical protein